MDNQGTDKTDKTDKTVKEYNIALVQGDEDIVLILLPFCKFCATNKLNILKLYNAEPEDIMTLLKLKTKVYKITCEC